MALPGQCPVSNRYVPILWNRGPDRPGWLAEIDKERAQALSETPLPANHKPSGNTVGKSDKSEGVEPHLQQTGSGRGEGETWKSPGCFSPALCPHTWRLRCHCFDKWTVSSVLVRERVWKLSPSQTQQRLSACLVHGHGFLLGEGKKAILAVKLASFVSRVMVSLSLKAT